MCRRLEGHCDEGMQRFMLAPGWSEGWPRKSRGAPSLTLVLEKRHYVRLRARPSVEGPWTWLREVAWDSSSAEAFSGGVGRFILGSATPSMYTARPSDVGTLQPPGPEVPHTTLKPAGPVRRTSSLNLKQGPVRRPRCLNVPPSLVRRSTLLNLSEPRLVG